MKEQNSHVKTVSLSVVCSTISISLSRLIYCTLLQGNQNQSRQVVAPKGLDISRSTTLILPNFFSQMTESIVCTLGQQQTRQHSSKKTENKQIASFCYGY